MRPAQLALLRAEARLAERLEQLEAKLAAGNESVWPAYAEAAATLAAIAPATVPGASGELITTKALADLMGCDPKTILRRRKAGTIGGAVQLGQRGRGALRWDVSAVRS